MSDPVPLEPGTGSLTWTPSDIPDLSGKTYIVTGGNSGIGYEASKHLALKGAHVIIATHVYTPGDSTAPADEIGGPEAVQKIKELKGNAQVEFLPLDLASFQSIREFAGQVSGRPLHGLINNAGLQTPRDGKTKDGLEITLGINFFGHAYLTQLLLPALKASAPARLVWVSSTEESIAEPDWSDIRGAKMGTDVNAYATSKLYMLMYGAELNKRLSGSGVESFTCHPGMSRTDIFRKGDHDKLTTVITDWAQWVAGQSAESGSYSLLYAATAPELAGHGGTYYGAYYKGPWTPNLLNTSKRTPDNKDAADPQKKALLYDETQKIIQEIADKVQGGASGATSATGVTGVTGAGTGQVEGGAALQKQQGEEGARSIAEPPAGVAST